MITTTSKLALLALVMLAGCKRTFFMPFEYPECYVEAHWVFYADTVEYARSEYRWYFLCDCLGTDADLGNWDETTCVTREAP